jgi:hypothetical protein
MVVTGHEWMVGGRKRGVGGVELRNFRDEERTRILSQLFLHWGGA